MASRNHHLDATGDREVVFCHGCDNEWYRDQRPNTLECPRCHGDITEIVCWFETLCLSILLIREQVSPESDPRNLDDNDSLPGFGQHRRFHHPHFDSDEDPDEDDIEEHLLRGPGGFYGHRSILRSPDSQGLRTAPRTAPENPDQIMRRFTELISDLGGNPSIGRSGPDTLFGGSQAPRVTLQRFSGPGFTGGVSSVTFTSSSARARPDPGHGPGLGPEDPFQR